MGQRVTQSIPELVKYKTLNICHVYCVEKEYLCTFIFTCKIYSKILRR